MSSRLTLNVNTAQVVRQKLGDLVEGLDDLVKNLEAALSEEKKTGAKVEKEIAALQLAVFVLAGQETPPGRWLMR